MPFLEIRQNLTYSIPQRFDYRFGGAKGPIGLLDLLFALICDFFGNFSKLLKKTQEFVPQVLNQVVNLLMFVPGIFLTGWKCFWNQTVDSHHILIKGWGA